MKNNDLPSTPAPLAPPVLSAEIATRITLHFSYAACHTALYPADRSISHNDLLRDAFPAEVTRQIILKENINNPLIKLLKLTEKEIKKLKKAAIENHKTIYSQIIDPDSLIRELPSITQLLNEISTFKVGSNLDPYQALFYSFGVGSEIINRLVEIGVEPMVLILDKNVPSFINARMLQQIISSMSSPLREALVLRLMEEGSLENRIQAEIIRGNEPALIALVESNEPEVRANIIGILDVAIKFGYEAIVEHILARFPSYYQESISSSSHEGFYLNFLSSATQAIIRGDHLCHLFVQPVIWNTYRYEDKVTLIRLITLRSGEVMQEILLQNLNDHNLLKTKLFIDAVNSKGLSVDQAKKIAEAFKPYHEQIFAETMASLMSVVTDGTSGYIRLVGMTISCKYIKKAVKIKFIQDHFDLIKEYLSKLVFLTPDLSNPEMKYFMEFMALMNAEEARREPVLEVEVVIQAPIQKIVEAKSSEALDDDLTTAIASIIVPSGSDDKVKDISRSDIDEAPSEHNSDGNELLEEEGISGSDVDDALSEHNGDTDVQEEENASGSAAEYDSDGDELLEEDISRSDVDDALSEDNGDTDLQEEENASGNAADDEWTLVDRSKTKQKKSLNTACIFTTEIKDPIVPDEEVISGSSGDTPGGNGGGAKLATSEVVLTKKNILQEPLTAEEASITFGSFAIEQISPTAEVAALSAQPSPVIQAEIIKTIAAPILLRLYENPYNYAIVECKTCWMQNTITNKLFYSLFVTNSGGEISNYFIDPTTGRQVHFGYQEYKLLQPSHLTAWCNYLWVAESNLYSIAVFDQLGNQIFQYALQPQTGQLVELVTVSNEAVPATTTEASSSQADSAQQPTEKKDSAKTDTLSNEHQLQTNHNIISLLSTEPKEVDLSISVTIPLNQKDPITDGREEYNESIAEIQKRQDEEQVAHIKYEEDKKIDMDLPGNYSSWHIPIKPLGEQEPHIDIHFSHKHLPIF